jgi:hypothetical protein
LIALPDFVFVDFEWRVLLVNADHGLSREIAFSFVEIAFIPKRHAHDLAVFWRYFRQRKAHFCKKRDFSIAEFK